MEHCQIPGGSKIQIPGSFRVPRSLFHGFQHCGRKRDKNLLQAAARGERTADRTAGFTTGFGSDKGWARGLRSTNGRVETTQWDNTTAGPGPASGNHNAGTTTGEHNGVDTTGNKSKKHGG